MYGVCSGVLAGGCWAIEEKAKTVLELAFSPQACVFVVLRAHRLDALSVLDCVLITCGSSFVGLLFVAHRLLRFRRLHSARLVPRLNLFLPATVIRSFLSFTTV